MARRRVHNTEKKIKMATEERNIENIDLAEESKEVNGVHTETPLTEERREEIVAEITKVKAQIYSLV